MKPGVLAYQQLRMAVAQQWITAPGGISDTQFQPASLDLSLGSTAYRVQSGFLSDGRAIPEILRDMTMYTLPLDTGAILERGQIYVIPLAESLHLSPDCRGRTNPKSSIGRLDIFTRVLANHGGRFDDIPAGYEGPLYLELFSRSFTIRVMAGMSLTQLRLFTGMPRLADRDLAALCRTYPWMLRDQDGHELSVCPGPYEPGVTLGLNVAGPVQGYRARRRTAILDLEWKSAYDPALFWDPIQGSGSVILEPEEFYLFTSKERLEIPACVAAELLAYDTGAGEIRTHYAGFFDPGFGASAWGGRGAQVVFEVRPHDVPFYVEDGQPFGTLCFDAMSDIPYVLYGDKDLGSHYTQDRIFSKYFCYQRESG